MVEQAADVDTSSEFRGVETPYQALVRRAHAAPAATFLAAPPSAELHYAPDGFCISYAEAAAEIERRGSRYARAGFGHGARVALIIGNRPDFFFHWLALNALGAAIVPINPDLGAADLKFQLDLAEPDLVVAVAEKQALLRSARADVPLIAPGDEEPPACRASVIRQHGRPADECALLFTSGTSDMPKGCVLANEYFWRLGNWYGAQGGIAEVGEGAETLLTPLPMFHMNALACSTLGMIMRGGAVVPLDRFHPRRWWRIVADSRATVIHYLGVMPAMLLKLPVDAVERAHRVRFGFGAGVDPRHQEAFEARFGFPLVEGWAMTETGAGAMTSTAQGPRHVGRRCIGRPVVPMELRIVDEAGDEVAPGEAGELLVRARGEPRRGFFDRYLKDPQATEKAWAGGWFHTGDVVRAGPDGSLFFVDRQKNIVRRSGENIAAIEVEGVLAALDRIADAAVAPVSDEMRGEEVCALIRLNEVRPLDASEARATARAIVRDCAARLAYFKAPGWVAFVDAIPTTATQKLKRAEIRTLAAALVAAGNAVDLRVFKGSLRHG